MKHNLLHLDAKPYISLVDFEHIFHIVIPSGTTIQPYRAKLQQAFNEQDYIILFGCESVGIYVDNMYKPHEATYVVENKLENGHFVTLYNKLNIKTNHTFMFIKFNTQENMLLAKTLGII